MKIVSILGARPQFIKAAPVIKALAENGIEEFLIHTGQHYDQMMSDIFFRELGMPEPDLNIDVGSGSHGYQTGNMLISIEEALIKQNPDLVMVYGDTNTTLAGALAACKLQIPLAHVESGLRSFNREMPEEYNRIVADHCADLLFCPTQTAVNNLKAEGIVKGVHLVGDTMVDALNQFLDIANNCSNIIKRLNIIPKSYLLATVHRPYNTDNPDNLRSILSAFQEINETIIFPVHPRTKKKLTGLPATSRQPFKKNLLFMEPIGYLDMIMLENNAKMILTDSGGIQKEAFIFGVPCITLRPETEWVETVESGWNIVVGADKQRIVEAVSRKTPRSALSQTALFGNGNAAQIIIGIIMKEKFDQDRCP